MDQCSPTVGFMGTHRSKSTLWNKIVSFLKYLCSRSCCDNCGDRARFDAVLPMVGVDTDDIESGRLRRIFSYSSSVSVSVSSSDSVEVSPSVAAGVDASVAADAVETCREWE